MESPPPAASVRELHAKSELLRRVCHVAQVISRGPPRPRRHRRSFFLTAALVAISMSPAAYFADFRAPPMHRPRRASPRRLARPNASRPQRPSTWRWSTRSRRSTPMRSPSPATHRCIPVSAYSSPSATPARNCRPSQHRSRRNRRPRPRSRSNTAGARSRSSAGAAPGGAADAEIALRPATDGQRIGCAGDAPCAAAPASAPQGDRSFMEKLFGVRPASPPANALSYASVDDATGSIAPSARLQPRSRDRRRRHRRLRHRRAGGDLAQRREAGSAFRPRRHDGQPAPRECAHEGRERRPVPTSSPNARRCSMAFAPCA